VRDRDGAAVLVRELRLERAVAPIGVGTDVQLVLQVRGERHVGPQHVERGTALGPHEKQILAVQVRDEASLLAVDRPVVAVLSASERDEVLGVERRVLDELGEVEGGPLAVLENHQSGHGAGGTDRCELVETPVGDLSMLRVDGGEIASVERRVAIRSGGETNSQLPLCVAKAELLEARRIEDGSRPFHASAHRAVDLLVVVRIEQDDGDERAPVLLCKREQARPDLHGDQRPTRALHGDVSQGIDDLPLVLVVELARSVPVVTCGIVRLLARVDPEVSGIGLQLFDRDGRRERNPQGDSQHPQQLQIQHGTSPVPTVAAASRSCRCFRWRAHLLRIGDAFDAAEPAAGSRAGRGPGPSPGRSLGKWPSIGREHRAPGGHRICRSILLGSASFRE
jgi:hypothetical protein